jgi:hypothetical protein
VKEDSPGLASIPIVHDKAEKVNSCNRVSGDGDLVTYTAQIMLQVRAFLFA